MRNRPHFVGVCLCQRHSVDIGPESQRDGEYKLRFESLFSRVAVPLWCRRLELVCIILRAGVGTSVNNYSHLLRPDEQVVLVIDRPDLINSDLSSGDESVTIGNDSLESSHYVVLFNPFPSREFILSHGLLRQKAPWPPDCIWLARESCLVWVWTERSTVRLETSPRLSI